MHSNIQARIREKALTDLISAQFARHGSLAMLKICRKMMTMYIQISRLSKNFSNAFDEKFACSLETCLSNQATTQDP